VTAMTDISIDPIELRLHPSFAKCARCDRPMRLQGIEPHMRLPDTDLHTYGCVNCGTTEVLMAPIRPLGLNGGG
jgi:hypothetical protein